MSGESLQQLTGSDAMWVRVEEWAGAQAVEEQVLAAVEHLLLPRINVAKDLQVGAPHLSCDSMYRSVHRSHQVEHSTRLLRACGGSTNGYRELDSAVGARTMCSSRDANFAPAELCTLVHRLLL